MFASESRFRVFSFLRLPTEARVLCSRRKELYCNIRAVPIRPDTIDPGQEDCQTELSARGALAFPAQTLFSKAIGFIESKPRAAASPRFRRPQ